MKIDYPKALMDLRVKMNVSQEELAKVLDVSVVSISRWENGHMEPTKLAKAKLNKLFEENDIVAKEIND